MLDSRSPNQWIFIFPFFANYSCWDLLFLFPQYCVQSKKNIWVENMFWLYLAAPVSRNPRNPILGLFLFLPPALFPSQPSARSSAIMNSLYLPSFSSLKEIFSSLSVVNMSVLFLELLMGIFKMKLFASLSTMALLNCILTAVKIVLMTINDCIGGPLSV